MRSLLSQAWHSWKGAKTVAVLAAIAFGVGIGSTTAIYTVVNAVMLKPLPYAQGDRLVALFAASYTEPDSYSSLSIPDLLEYQQRTRSFDVFGLFRSDKLVPQIRHAIQRIDPTQPIHGVATMNEIIQGSLSRERAGSFMMAFFALAALLMAVLGIYGVVAYSVRQRRVEIGTRMALGAVARDILFLIVGGGLKMATYGVALGAVAVVGAVWLLLRVFDVQNLGWPPFAFSSVAVATLAIVASIFPAWRAALLSPMVAIRDEPESIWESARQRIRHKQ